MHYHISGLMFDLAGFFNRVDHYLFIAPTGDTALTNIPVTCTIKQMHIFMVVKPRHLHPSFAKRLHFEGGFSYVIGEKQNGEYLPLFRHLNFDWNSVSRGAFVAVLRSICFSDQPYCI